MIAYCGIDCSECDNYLATQSGSQEDLKMVAEKLSKIYRAEVIPEYVLCDGCRAGERKSYFCDNLCKMHKCCTERKYYSCIECNEIPCKELQAEIKNKPKAMGNLNKLKDTVGVDKDKFDWGFKGAPTF